jgi:hypothetical protein
LAQNFYSENNSLSNLEMDETQDERNEILFSLCKIYGIDDFNLLVECATMTQQVIKQIPRL